MRRARRATGQLCYGATGQPYYGAVGQLCYGATGQPCDGAPPPMSGDRSEIIGSERNGAKMATQQPAQSQYPVQFSVDYPDRDLNRVTTAFRIFTVIPIAIVLGAVSGGTWQWSYGHGATATVAAGRRPALLRPAADDPVPPEVPALVVRLEP